MGSAPATSACTNSSPLTALRCSALTTPYCLPFGRAGVVVIVSILRCSRESVRKCTTVNVSDRRHLRNLLGRRRSGNRQRGRCLRKSSFTKILRRNYIRVTSDCSDFSNTPSVYCAIIACVFAHTSIEQQAI